MDTVPYEFTAHRIGGSDQAHLERVWGPRVSHLCLDPGSLNRSTMDGGRFNMSSSLYVEITPHGLALPDWTSVTMALSDVNGRPIGSPRPAMLYEKPCDIASHVTFIDQWDGSVFSIGVRRVGIIDPVPLGDNSPEAQQDAVDQALDPTDREPF